MVYWDTRNCNENIQVQAGSVENTSWASGYRVRLRCGFLPMIPTLGPSRERHSVLHTREQHSKLVRRPDARKVRLVCSRETSTVSVRLPRPPLNTTELTLVARGSKRKTAERDRKLEQKPEQSTSPMLNLNGFKLPGTPISSFWFLGGVVVLSLGILRRLLGSKEVAHIPAGSVRYRASNDAELHVYRCGKCGYTLYPARGRELKFFPRTFKCPQCSAPKSEFWDLNDPNDPRNQETESDETDEASLEQTQSEDAPDTPQDTGGSTPPIDSSPGENKP
jgi:rubredoxin